MHLIDYAQEKKIKVSSDLILCGMNPKMFDENIEIIQKFEKLADFLKLRWTEKSKEYIECLDLPKNILPSGWGYNKDYPVVLMGLSFCEYDKENDENGMESTDINISLVYRNNKFKITSNIYLDEQLIAFGPKIKFKDEISVEQMIENSEQWFKKIRTFSLMKILDQLKTTISNMI